MKTQVYVWDKFVRLFHWLLVALFITSYVSGENEYDFHAYSGYAIISLLTLRLIWGFIGSPYARFTEFVKGPSTTIAYLKSIAAGHPKRYIGHNPAGAAMIIALLTTLALTTFSGLKLYGVEEGAGPFAVIEPKPPVMTMEDGQHDQDYSDKHEQYEEFESEEHEAQEEFWEEIHEACISLLLLLITLHVIGVIVASRQHREALVKSMVTGYKDAD